MAAGSHDTRASEGDNSSMGATANDANQGSVKTEELKSEVEEAAESNDPASAANASATNASS
eukprot:8759683-Karenia_brevis.AAC.1